MKVITLLDAYDKNIIARLSTRAKKQLSRTSILENTETPIKPDAASDFIKSKQRKKAPFAQRMENVQAMLNSACDTLGIPHMELQVQKGTFWQKLTNTSYGSQKDDACVIPQDAFNSPKIVETVAHEAFHHYIGLVRRGLVPLRNNFDAGAIADKSSQRKSGRKAYISNLEEHGARHFGINFAKKYNQPTNHKKYTALEKKYCPDIEAKYWEAGLQHFRKTEHKAAKANDSKRAPILSKIRASLAPAELLNGRITVKQLRELRQIYRSSHNHKLGIFVQPKNNASDTTREGVPIIDLDYKNTLTAPKSFSEFLSGVIGSGSDNRLVSIVAMPNENLEFSPGKTQPMYYPTADGHRLIPEFVVGNAHVNSGNMMDLVKNPNYSWKHNNYSHEGLTFDNSVMRSYETQKNEYADELSPPYAQLRKSLDSKAFIKQSLTPSISHRVKGVL